MRTSLKAAILAVTFSLSWAAHAQQVTRFITGGAPGAPMDLLTRSLAEAMAPLMSRTIIVENKPGASYNIAGDFVAKSPADGNTVLLTFNVHPMSGLLFSKLSYDPIKDFRAVGVIGTVPYLVLANPALQGNSLKEMIALAKAQGRAPSFATVGQGTPHHLMMEGVKGQDRADFRMVHYKSAGQALMDVVAGHVDFTLHIPTDHIDGQVKAGKLKVLAVTSAQRFPEYPQAPTVSEMGYQGFVTNGWFGMLLPAKTPADVVAAYNVALNKALVLPAIRDRLKTIGSTAVPGTPETLDQMMRTDEAMWRRIITQNNIKVE